MAASVRRRCRAGRGAGTTPDAADLPGAGRDRGRRPPVRPARWPLLGLLAAAFAVYLRLGPCAGRRWRWRAGGRPLAGHEQPGRPGAQPPSPRLRPDLRHRPGPRAGRGVGPGWPGGPWPGGRPTSPGSASRCSPRPPARWCGPATASATTGAAPRCRACSTWPSRAPSASCSGPGGSSATTSCSTSAAGSMPPWPTCAAAPSGSGPATGSPPASSWASAGLRQLDRAPPPLPAHGPPQRPTGRRPAAPLRPGRRAPQPAAVRRPRSALGAQPPAVGEQQVVSPGRRR
jgi:hypothetical protein